MDAKEKILSSEVLAARILLCIDKNGKPEYPPATWAHKVAQAHLDKLKELAEVKEAIKAVKPILALADERAECAERRDAFNYKERMRLENELAEAKARLDACYRDRGNARRQRNKAEAERDKLKAALEFYAHPSHYEEAYDEVHGPEEPPIFADKGFHAQQAIQDIGSKE